MSINLQKKLIGFFALIFLVIGFDKFLESKTYIKLLEHYNGASYFYLTLDWQKKIDLASHKITPDTILFLGSSRTAYAIDPKAFPDAPLLNLSLVAGSFNENALFSEVLVKKNVHAKKIYFELNPMSATRRHMKSMDNEENRSLFIDHPLFFPSNIYQQRFILKDILTSFFNNKNSDEAYRFEKRKNHLLEFEAILDKNFEGHIPGRGLTGEFRERATNECRTMLNWTTSDENEDFSVGLIKFNEIISNLKKVSNEIIVWIPPKPQNYALNEQEEFAIQKFTEETKKLNIKLIDLNDLQAREPIQFFDCIHPAKESSKIITNTLLRS